MIICSTNLGKSFVLVFTCVLPVIETFCGSLLACCRFCSSTVEALHKFGEAKSPTLTIMPPPNDKPDRRGALKVRILASSDRCSVCGLIHDNTLLLGSLLACVIGCFQQTRWRRSYQEHKGSSRDEECQTKEKCGNHLCFDKPIAPSCSQ